MQAGLKMKMWFWTILLKLHSSISATGNGVGILKSRGTRGAQKHLYFIKVHLICKERPLLYRAT